MNRFHGLALATALSAALPAAAQTPATTALPPAAPAAGVPPVRLDAGVFSLGEMVVVGRDDRLYPTTWPATVSRLDAATIAALDANRVSEALAAIPGITLNPGNRGGARNESGFFLRGFDQSRVPVMLDGIPLYVPYDGYLDLNRTLTTDLARIEVTKGFAPMVAGPNALGGMVNLVTRRPERLYEADGQVGFDLNRDGTYSGTRTALNFGSRWDDYYVQGGIAFIGVEQTQLPQSFSRGLYQPNGNRVQSDSQDFRLSGKIGYVPNATDEYAIGFALSRGEKGAPPYAGLDATRATFFNWPSYDRDSLYLLTRTALPVGNESYVRTRVFYDTFANSLYRYDDVNYRSFNRPFAFRSRYNDDGIGAGVELGTSPFAGNTVRVGVNVKQDTHREDGVRVPQSTMEDRTWQFGIDMSQAVTPWLSLTGGLGYEMRDAISAQDPSNNRRAFPTSDQNATNAQIGFRALLNPTNDIYGNIARRSRFATMYERYSYRLGNGLPNPGLEPERATNMELGYETRPTPGLRFAAAGFYSLVDNWIQPVTVGRATTAPFGAITQAQNIGGATFYGAELVAEATVNNRLRISANYTYLVRQRDEGDALPLYGTPRQRVFGLATWQATEGLQVIPSVQGQSGQFTTDTGNRRPIGGWVSANIKLAQAVGDNWTIEGSVNNIADTLYSTDDGYPSRGRYYLFTLRGRI